MRKSTWLLITWFGVSSRFSRIRGTWGTLATLPFAFVIQYFLGNIALGFAAAILFLLGVAASHDYVTSTGKQDPGEIVIDEVAATCALLAFMPLSWQSYLVAFVVFRFFDILKPWPVSWADQKLKGGFGVMVDDMLAGVYPVVLMMILAYFRPDIAERILAWLSPA